MDEIGSRGWVFTGQSEYINTEIEMRAMESVVCAVMGIPNSHHEQTAAKPSSSDEAYDFIIELRF